MPGSPRPRCITHVAKGRSLFICQPLWLEENTKGKDFVGRYGGDEFILLLPMTTLYSASIVADNLGKAVSKRNLTVKRTGKSMDKITISLGVSQIHEDDTTDSVIERAAAALTLAKKTKLDRVKSEKDL
jgi:diguanylate cyclase